MESSCYGLEEILLNQFGGRFYRRKGVEMEFYNLLNKKGKKDYPIGCCLLFIEDVYSIWVIRCVGNLKERSMIWLRSLK